MQKEMKEKVVTRGKNKKNSLSIHRNIVPLHPILNKTIE